ncbi:hypothetical protein IM511_05070 [Erythrobacteraceae bacterium E2-1 Yellow Sea]|nr:hypothetical protein [Erythrobacteraceae bacterium E2-1 Yellow Sea]
MAIQDRDTAFKQFDTMGVDHVRLQYGGPPPEGAGVNLKMIYSWAKQWLAKFDEAERLSGIEDKEDAKRIARSAKNAAWIAAIAATIAAIAAVVAIVTSS